MQISNSAVPDPTLSIHSFTDFKGVFSWHFQALRLKSSSGSRSITSSSGSGSWKKFRILADPDPDPDIQYNTDWSMPCWSRAMRRIVCGIALDLMSSAIRHSAGSWFSVMARSAGSTYIQILYKKISLPHSAGPHIFVYISANSQQNSIIF
jgi:hypothetical protein